ncbi:MAG: U32 family peptidase [Ruminococcus sp.]|jgi:putative protease|nr:U32 family peptidase [Ruminococcus sp.]
MKKIELLSPAGDFERLRAAVMYGADAVYLGTSRFSMRSMPPNFDEKTLKEAVLFAHKNGVKAYLTANSIPRDNELKFFPAFLENAAEADIDALIIADLGLLSLARKHLPDMEIHMSTQTGIVNAAAAQTLYDMGVKRAVLARELSLDEIADIRAAIPREMSLEAFVHGSMCVSFSGRCLLSHYMTGRDANRGACAQTCRWSYALCEETRPGQFFPIEEEPHGTFILNSKDLNTLPILDKITAAGVDSLKIEGRAKSAYYTAAATNAYRAAIDIINAGGDYALPDWVMSETEKFSHRPYSFGFYTGGGGEEYYASSGYTRDWDIIAVTVSQNGRRLFCEQRNKFLPGTDAEIMIPKIPPQKIRIEKLYGENGDEIPDTRHAQMPFSFDLPENAPTIPSGAFIRTKHKN